MSGPGEGLYICESQMCRPIKISYRTDRMLLRQHLCRGTWKRSDGYSSFPISNRSRYKIFTLQNKAKEGKSLMIKLGFKKGNFLFKYQSMTEKHTILLNTLLWFFLIIYFKTKLSLIILILWLIDTSRKFILSLTHVKYSNKQDLPILEREKDTLK